MKLLKSDFTALANVMDTKTPILRYEVPRGAVIGLKKGIPFCIYLATRQVFSLAAEASRTSYIATVSHKIAQNALWDHTKNRIARATWKGNPTTITAIDYANRQITCAVDDTAGDLVIDYMPEIGTLEIVGEAPGMSQVKKVFYAGDLAILQTIDQYAGKTAPKLAQDIFLPQNFFLSVYLQASWVAQIDAPNTIVEFLYEQAPVAVAVAQLAKVRPGVDLTSAVIRSWVGE